VPPEIKYARLQGDQIAYQVLGEGPPDLVLTPGSFSHLDIAWEDPGVALFCRTLASFCRLILFNRRGTGASDPLPPDPLPPWEAYADELTAVLDVVGSQRAALLAELDSGPTAILFAATKPERVSALVLAHTTAKSVATGDYPIGLPAEAAEALVTQFDQLWGTEALAATLIQAPTLVMHRRDAQLIPIEHGRYLAEHIPGAKLVELSGADTTLIWEAPELALDHIGAFLTGAAGSLRQRGCWRRCCSLTSWAPPNGRTGWGIGAGVSCWKCTTSWPPGWSRSSTDNWSRRPATGSWPPSTGPDARSAARPPLGTSYTGSGSTSGQDCTPAKWNKPAVMSAALPCTSLRG
jgi:pimeloyl-ACP methyl ester carboxylesterase